MNVADERELAFRSTLDDATRKRLPPPKWRASGVAAQIVFFILTSLAIAALFLLCVEMELPKGWVTAGLAIATAEYLIRRFHFAATGVETTLWLGGLFAFIFGLPGEGKPEALLLFAIACATAGLRVRNAVIMSGAAVFVLAYLNAKDWSVVALIAGVVIATVAVAMLTREWQRPSTDSLFVMLMFVAPIAGAWQTLRDENLGAIAFFIALAIAEIYVGVRYRLRSALVAAAVPIVLAFITARDLFRWLQPEWKLMLGGATVFAISVAVSRSLRDKKRGFVITPIKSALEDALQVFGSAAFAPHIEKNFSSEPIGGGGTFGGAGSSGTF